MSTDQWRAYDKHRIDVRDRNERGLRAWRRKLALLARPGASVWNAITAYYRRHP